MSAELLSYASEVERRAGLPRGLLLGLIEQESSWKPKAIGRNSNGTVDAGLTQINQVNWKTYGIQSAKDLTENPKLAIDIGADILKKSIQATGDVFLGLAAYNGGVGSVREILAARAKGDQRALAQRAAKITGYASSVLGRAVRYGYELPSTKYLETGIKMLGFANQKQYLAKFQEQARANAPAYLKRQETAFEVAAPAPVTPTAQPSPMDAQPVLAIEPVRQAKVNQADAFAIPPLDIPSQDDSAKQVRAMIAEALGMQAKQKSDVPDPVSELIYDELRSL